MSMEEKKPFQSHFIFIILITIHECLVFFAKLITTMSGFCASWLLSKELPGTKQLEKNNMTITMNGLFS